jgi:hypothetical protein
MRQLNRSASSDCCLRCLTRSLADEEEEVTEIESTASITTATSQLGIIYTNNNNILQFLGSQKVESTPKNSS